MDAKTAAKRLTDLTRGLGTAYVLLTATLAALPVPMNLPRQADDPSLALRTLDMAWDLAGTEPLPAVTVKRIRDMITAWVTAYELTVIAGMSGPAPWRLRGIEDAVLRLREAGAEINRHLEGDFRKNEVADADRADVDTWLAAKRKHRYRPGR